MLFYVFAAIAVVTSLLVVTRRHPVHSVMLLIASFGALSGLYVLLDAPFAAAIQLIVYAGAIMVLFLFVVMLLHAGREPGPGTDEETTSFAPGAMKLGAALALLLGVELVWALTRADESGAFPGGAVSDVRTIGRVLFTEYAFAFEVTSILILVAMVGAVVLARREGAS
jgi:NADH-quinone oxidoreductase subunit J